MRNVINKDLKVKVLENTVTQSRKDIIWDKLCQVFV